VVVPNGCDASEFQGLKRDPSRHSRFVLLHAGSLYGARNPAALFRAVARAVASGRIDRAGFRFRFLGRTGIDLEKMAAETGVSDLIEIVDHVPRRQSLQEMLDASALLILQPITRVSVPAKLYEYLAAGRPVLAIAEPGGETADLVARSGIGVVAAAENEKAIEDQVVSLVANAGGTPPPVARQLYDGELRAGELAGILERASTDVTPRA
jgi:glycosyltransferase involved in cell wall biosynthesis